MSRSALQRLAAHASSFISSGGAASGAGATRHAGGCCAAGGGGGLGSLGGAAAGGRLPRGAAAACGGALHVSVRHMGVGVEGIADKTLAKARKMAVAVGALAGVFGSLVGVGGGVLISPVIANICRALPQRVISGTSLAAVAATGTAAGAVYWSSGAVDLTSAAIIATSAVTLTPLGARATHKVDCNQLRRLMAYWLFLVAPLVPLKPLLLRHYAGAGEAGAAGVQAQAAPPAAAAGAAPAAAGGSSAAPAGAQQPSAAHSASTATPTATGTPSSTSSTGGGGAVAPQLWRPLRPSDALLAATGMLAGFASGLLGIGGGTVVTPLLTVTTGLPQLSVLGTSLCAMVVPSLVGLAQHARLGNVDVLMGLGLAAGTMVGGAAGSKLALVMPEGVLEWVFCFGMIYLGRKTLKGAAAGAKGAAAVAAAVGRGAPAAAQKAGSAAAAAGGGSAAAGGPKL